MKDATILGAPIGHIPGGQSETDQSLLEMAYPTRGSRRILLEFLSPILNDLLRDRKLTKQEVNTITEVIRGNVDIALAKQAGLEFKTAIEAKLGKMHAAKMHKSPPGEWFSAGFLYVGPDIPEHFLGISKRAKPHIAKAAETAHEIFVVDKVEARILLTREIPLPAEEKQKNYFALDGERVQIKTNPSYVEIEDNMTFFVIPPGNVVKFTEDKKGDTITFCSRATNKDEVERYMCYFDDLKRSKPKRTMEDIRKQQAAAQRRRKAAQQAQEK